MERAAWRFLPPVGRWAGSAGVGCWRSVSAAMAAGETAGRQISAERRGASRASGSSSIASCPPLPDWQT